MTNSIDLRPRRRRRPIKPLIIGAAVVVAAVVLVLAGFNMLAPSKSAHAVELVAAPSSTVPYVAPDVSAVAQLPEAKYDAVIGGLIPVGGADLPARVTTWSLAKDAALYGADEKTPVARLAARNFLNQPTPVVAVKTDGPWTLILTPARQKLPSKAAGHAPAQTAAWVRTSALANKKAITSSITVSTSAQTLTITGQGKTTTYNVGVGMDKTPTPTDVTGYIQARYLDPEQGQSTYQIQLTSLHSETTDEPLAGGTGGLIGVHYEKTNAGQVSHGCIRLPVDAIKAVNALPLGTPMRITK